MSVASIVPTFLLRHRLPPFPGEAFGGSAGLVDVQERSRPLDESVGPDHHTCVAELDPPGAADGTATLHEHSESHSIAEILDLIGLRLVVIVGRPPFFEERAYRLTALDHPEPTPRDVPHRVRGKEA